MDDLTLVIKSAEKATSVGKHWFYDAQTFWASIGVIIAALISLITVWIKHNLDSQKDIVLQLQERERIATLIFAESDNNFRQFTLFVKRKHLFIEDMLDDIHREMFDKPYHNRIYEQEIKNLGYLPVNLCAAIKLAYSDMRDSWHVVYLQSLACLEASNEVRSLKKAELTYGFNDVSEHIATAFAKLMMELSKEFDFPIREDIENWAKKELKIAPLQQSPDK